MSLVTKKLWSTFVIGLALALFNAPVASAGDILIYGPSLLGAPNNEATLATAAGHTVTVDTPVTWLARTTASFASFDAIVFGDPTCQASPADLTFAEANKATWSAAVKGNIVVIGTDPVFHQLQGQANVLTTNAINFAASGGSTGLYMSLSCYYFSAPANTPVSILSEFGTFTVQGQFIPPLNGCPEDVTIVLPSHPVVSGITEPGLENWGCSIHEAFDAFPVPLVVVVTDAPSSLPYIIAGKSPTGPTPGKVTGGGQIEGDPIFSPLGDLLSLPALVPSLADPAAQATFGFVVKCCPATGNLEYDDHQADVRIKALSFDKLFISSPGTSCPATPGSKHATFTGTASVIRPIGTTTEPLTVDVDDCGEPGTADTFGIKTTTYSNGPSTLTGGNIQIHK